MAIDVTCSRSRKSRRIVRHVIEIGLRTGAYHYFFRITIDTKNEACEKRFTIHVLA